MRILSALPLLALTVTLQAQSPARTGRDYAVFFVAAKFDNGWAALPDAAGETNQLAGDLREGYGFDVKIVADAKRADILKVLGEYKRKTYGPDDQLFLYFSMHGYHDKNSDAGYLIPKDGLYDEVTYDSWLAHSTLQELLVSMPCKRILVGLDACYSGIFGRGRDKPTAADWEEGTDCASKLKAAFSAGAARKYTAAGGDERVPAKSAFAELWHKALQRGYGDDDLLSFAELSAVLDQYRNPRPVFGDFARTALGDFVFVRKNGCGAKVETADRDGDGIPNADDRCPDAYGTATNNGCPETNAREGSTDADLDGIPDPTDACPNEYGTTKAKGCPDADDDGVPDRSDKCRYAPGEARWEGCPDSDGDGLPDHLDHCPDQKGPTADSGCPPSDRDRDGVPDRSDKCPDAAGKANFSGCPDTDGDGIPDPDDKCPTEKGEASRDGCPRPDIMALVRGRTFQMGSNEGDKDEKPVHIVTVSDFYLSKYEVTVAEFRAFVEATSHQTDAEKEGSSYGYEGTEWKQIAGRNWRHDPEGKPAQDKHPVINVSWNDATAYCQWLSQKTGLTYRLPTEAEWEYAAGNGARHTKYSWGNGDPAGRKGGSVADETGATHFNWTKNATNIFMGYNDGYAATAPVGAFDPNDFGLYDMNGNVWEWCSDWKDPYATTAETNPTGPSSGSSRVIRGGSWFDYPRYCRVADRSGYPPGTRLYYVGFRLARTK